MNRQIVEHAAKTMLRETLQASQIFRQHAIYRDRTFWHSFEGGTEGGCPTPRTLKRMERVALAHVQPLMAGQSFLHKHNLAVTLLYVGVKAR
jgi:hypothetical protein